MGNEGLGGIARRWVKKSIDELTADNRQERQQANIGQQNAENDFRDKASEEAILTAVPGLRNLRDHQVAQRTEAEARREADAEAEIAARPLAGIGLQLTGAVEASWSGQLPARVERIDATAPSAEELEWNPWAGEASVRVDLTPSRESLPLIGGEPLLTWTFVVPGYTGAGTYDLQAIALEREAQGCELDPFDHALVLGSEDEPYNWYSGVPGSIEVADDERSLVVRLTMVSAGGELNVVASVNLPA